MRLSLLVMAGGALGSLARYWVAIWVAQLTGGVFPWGTLLINVGGSFVIGLAAAATDAAQSPAFRAFLMVGICGGYTTFSSFSLQTMELMQFGRVGLAGAYVVGSVMLCLIGVWMGWALGQAA